MRTLIVIKLHVISNSRTEFTNVFRRVEIYVLLLDAAPEAFYPYIVFTTTSTIHAYLYAIAGQQILPVLGRILASLVRIHSFRCSVHPDTFSHQLIGIGSCQRRTGDRSARERTDRADGLFSVFRVLRGLIFVSREWSRV